ncbi:GNAT family N-acetyltransferase [Metabacillus flavus]
MKPDFTLKHAYMEFYEEWKNSEEKIVPWVVAENPADFEKYLHYLKEQEQGKNIPENFVPHSTYWLLLDKDRIAGAVNIRHRLNEYLKERGGHIGYGIRPSERQKGYATAILSLALAETKRMGIKEVLVTCDKTNIASEKTIIKNGGKFDSEFTEENGNVVKRFWIAD